MTNEKSGSFRPVAVVTGGSEGFGRELAASLVRSGWTVRIDGRRPNLVREVADEIGAVPVPGDITDPAHRRDLLGTGRLDLLVNNAGTLGPTPLPPLTRITLDGLRDLFETNVVAPLALVQEAYDRLADSEGAVLNLTSDAAVEAYEGWGGYGASKAALERVSAVLAAECPGLKVWWFDPGDMRTSMHQAAFPGEDISDRPLPVTVVPAVLTLLRVRPPSGRVRAADLLVAS
jgi:NAD(P)-dependent dehydrogenase (short-subunit alcohol dehydrogenase family)